jgi:hypothetical protein
MTEEPRTEQEWADFYQAQKDDLDIWEEVPSPIKRPPGRPSQGFASRITVRFTPTETDIIRRAARAQGVGYSEVVRRAVLALEGRAPADAESA